MTMYFKIAAFIFLAASFAAAADAVPQTDVVLNLELLLVKPEGIYLIRTSEPKIGHGGISHSMVKLEEDDPAGDLLVYSLAYRMSGPDRIKLALRREVGRGPDPLRELPAVTETISTLESWTTTVLEEDDRLGGKLILRVVPMLRQREFDEDFDSWRTPMLLAGGPLLEYVEHQADHPYNFQDQVIFREVNLGGLGLEMGIQQVGIVRLSHFRFSGATTCGWVRGGRYFFAVGGHSFGGWSETPILPDDTERSEKGWTLYCTLKEDSEIRGYYGNFDPTHPE